MKIYYKDSSMTRLLWRSWGPSSLGPPSLDSGPANEPPLSPGASGLLWPGPPSPDPGAPPEGSMKPPASKDQRTLWAGRAWESHLACSAHAGGIPAAASPHGAFTPPRNHSVLSGAVCQGLAWVGGGTRPGKQQGAQALGCVFPARPPSSPTQGSLS